jgi:hypothetical protein
MTKKNKENKIDSPIIEENKETIETSDDLEIGGIIEAPEGADLKIKVITSEGEFNMTIIAEDKFTANIIEEEIKYEVLEDRYISSNYHNFTFKKGEIYPISILENKFGKDTFNYMIKCTNLKHSLVENKVKDIIVSISEDIKVNDEKTLVKGERISLSNLSKLFNKKALTGLFKDKKILETK